MESNNKEKYNILQFDFNGGKIREYAQDELTNTLNYTWVSLFCTDVSDKIEKPIEKSTLTGVREAEFRFDLFRPVLAMLDSDTGLTKGIEKRPDDNPASVSDEVKIGDGQYLSDMSHLVSVKNMIANYDIQNWIKRKVQKKIDELQEGDERKIDKIWEEFYKIIDSWVDNVAYLGEKSILGKVCFGDNLGNSTMGDVVFLCNDNNSKEYIKEYKEHLTAIIKETIKKARQIKDSAEEEAIEVAVKQMIGGISSYSVKRNIILSMEDKKTSSQLLQRIPRINELIVIKQQFEDECNILADIKKEKENREAISLKTKIEIFLKKVQGYEGMIKKI